MFACTLSLMVVAGIAQERPMAFAAPSPGITVESNVQYGVVGTTRLAMDVYRPSAAEPGRPAMIFFNHATGDDRHGRFYDAWARAAASKGIVGILPDLRSGSERADFRLLMDYLSAHGPEHGVGAIAVYAGSGNVDAALPAVEDPAMADVRAAIMYYGDADVSSFRPDLPVLFVRAGLDRPAENRAIGALAAAAVAGNAPVTLLNHAGGHHAFELTDPDAATRAVIDETLAFVTRVTSPDYQASLRASLAEAIAAGQVQTGKSREAVASYARLVATHPTDVRLRLAYGEALLADAQYAAACTEFDALRDKGLGYRDLGLPAAEACLKKGDQDAAIAWLRSIPERFRGDVRENPAFAALRNRRDFQDLFPSRLL
jgi:hypothetical protein